MRTQTDSGRYLAMNHPFNVVADEDGGYLVVFPDLPGCFAQVDSIHEVSAAAAEIRELWIETELEAGREIPGPSYAPEYSGRFNVRIPKSLHKRLAESAAEEGVSLNQLVVSMLSSGFACMETHSVR